MENHHVGIENREKITITQVTDVEAFDEETLWANLKDGAMELTGNKLSIERLDLKEGILVVSGSISGLTYTDRKIKEKKSFFGRRKTK